MEILDKADIGVFGGSGFYSFLKDIEEEFQDYSNKMDNIMQKQENSLKQKDLLSEKYKQQIQQLQKDMESIENLYKDKNFNKQQELLNKELKQVEQKQEEIKKELSDNQIMKDLMKEKIETTTQKQQLDFIQQQNQQQLKNIQNDENKLNDYLDDINNSRQKYKEF